MDPLLDLDDEERTILASVGSGEMPLEVYADWLEERGDERATGARWLADHGKEPCPVGQLWRWLPERDPRGLPPDVYAELPPTAQPFATALTALLVGINAAANVYTD